MDRWIASRSNVPGGLSTVKSSWSRRCGTARWERGLSEPCGATFERTPILECGAHGAALDFDATLACAATLECGAHGAALDFHAKVTTGDARDAVADVGQLRVTAAIFRTGHGTRAQCRPGTVIRSPASESLPVRRRGDAHRFAHGSVFGVGLPAVDAPRRGGFDVVAAPPSLRLRVTMGVHG